MKRSYKSYLVTFIILLFAIWGQSRDELLLPVVKDTIDTSIETSIPPEQNAFFAMLGFNVLDPNTFVEAGYQALQKATKEVKNNPLEFMQLFDLPKTQDKDLELYQLPCDANQVNQDCLARVVTQKKLINQYITEQQSFIENYLIIQKYTKFAHLFPPNINASLPLLYISDISQLLTAQAILDIKAGNMKQGMKFLLADIKFYRDMLTNQQRNLEETNAFVTTLLQHYFVIDRLAHAGVDLKPYSSELAPLLEPLSKQQRSLVWALENERKNNLSILISLGYQNFYTGNNEIAGCQKDSCSLPRYPLRLIYKFNGSLNASYQDWQPTIDFAKQDYPLNDNYLSQLKILQQIEINHHQMKIPRLYQRYGLFLFKNYEGENQKNNTYYAEGYTLWFIKVYLLNNSINQVSKLIQNIN